MIKTSDQCCDKFHVNFLFKKYTEFYLCTNITHEVSQSLTTILSASPTSANYSCATGALIYFTLFSITRIKLTLIVSLHCFFAG